MLIKVRLAAVLIACGFLAGCGEYCLYQGACLEPDFFSLDPSPVQVDLTSPNPKAASKVLAQLRIPRSYIVRADNYSSRKGPLPDQIATQGIAIRFVDNGEAWTVASKKPDERQWRWREYQVSLRANANPNGRTDRQANLAGYGRIRQSDRYEGLTHFSGSGEIFVGDASDSFESISCHEELKPSWFCTYEIDVGDTITVSAKFVDFRLHGGRAYANQRAQFVREFVCKFTDCEPDEARRRRLAARPFIGDQKRNVCIARDLPQKTVALGLAANVQSTFPPAVTQQTFWRLQVPIYFREQDAWPRSDASSSLFGAVLFPEMVPSAPIEGELRNAWLTVPVSDQERAAFLTVPENIPCLAHAELSLEDLAQRTIHLQLRRPDGYPMTTEIAPPSQCANKPGASRHFCSVRFLRDGWHVDISFGSQWRSDAERIRDQVNSWLDQVTLSRDPVPAASPASSDK